MSRIDVKERLQSIGIVTDDEAGGALDVLLEFGFLGIRLATSGETTYAFASPGNIRRFTVPVESDVASLVVHPAFHAALGIT
jgi:hypothetical protein